jgi:hypothetical protein
MELGNSGKEEEDLWVHLEMEHKILVSEQPITKSHDINKLLYYWKFKY